jgi:hypothetical protein
MTRLRTLWRRHRKACLCAEAERDAAIRALEALEAVEAALALDGRSSIRVVAAREAINDWRDGEAP